jgi:hypothetical protein
MLHRRDGASFPPDVTLGIPDKEFNLGFIRPENLLSVLIVSDLENKYTIWGIVCI